MFGEFIGAFEAVLVMVLLILTGFFLTKFQKIDKRVSGFISWTVVNITLPCYMLHNITTSFEPAEIRAYSAVYRPAVGQRFDWLCAGVGYCKSVSG